MNSRIENIKSSEQKRILLVLEPFREEHLEKIAEAVGEEFQVETLPAQASEEALAAGLKRAEIVVGQPPLRLLQNPRQSCPNLRLIQMTWAGTDQYTQGTQSFPKEQIRLANASGAYGHVISQFVVGTLLSLFLNLPAYQEQQKKQVWERRGPIRSLEHARVLIFGAGDIGGAVAHRLQGFDVTTVGVCRDTKRQRPFFDELCTLAEAEQQLPWADIVVGCLPNSEETCGYLNAERLKRMKKDAVVVNVGRGNFIDGMALWEELSNGHLFGAALDVTNPEPLPKEHPLWKHPRCIITPHASGVTFGHLQETEELLCRLVCDNMTRYVRGEDLRNRIL